MTNTEKSIISNDSWNLEKKDKSYSHCVGIYLVLNELNAVIQNTLGITGSTLKIIRMLITFIIFTLFLRCIIHFNKKERGAFAITMLSVLFLYGYSWACGSKTSDLISWGITTIGICVPLGFFSYCVNDKSIFYSALYKYTYPVLALLILNLMGSSNFRYDMHFSYMLLYVIIFHLSYLLSRKKYYFVFLVAFEITILLAYGSRGAIVCIAAYLLLYIVTRIKNVIEVVVYSLIVILFCIAIQYFLDNYGSVMLYKLQSMGFASRSLKLLLNGSFSSHDTGRNYIWKSSLELIKQKLMFGWGIHGASEALVAPYPHQLFLDIWISFGSVLGSIIAIIIILPIRNILIGKNTVAKDLNQMFFSMAFISLMFSGTLFTSYYFFIMLGLLFNKSTFNNEK